MNTQNKTLRKYLKLNAKPDLNILLMNSHH